MKNDLNEVSEIIYWSETADQGAFSRAWGKVVFAPPTAQILIFVG